MNYNALTYSDQELISEFQKADKLARELWGELIARNLGLIALGIDPEKRDSSWHNPVILTLPKKSGNGKKNSAKLLVNPDDFC